MGPHAADVDDGAAAARRDHAAGHGLGEEEDGPVQFEIGVVGGAVIVQEGLGKEKPGGVDQQGGIGVLIGQLLAHPLHLHPGADDDHVVHVVFTLAHGLSLDRAWPQHIVRLGNEVGEGPCRRRNAR